MSDRMDDRLWRQVADLTPIIPDPVYSANLRIRCQAALAQRHQERSVRAEARTGRGRTLEVVVVAGFAFVYVVAVVFNALASYGML